MNLSADIICDIIDVSSATANVPVTGNYLTFAVHRRALVARDTINQKKDFADAPLRLLNNLFSSPVATYILFTTMNASIRPNKFCLCLTE